MVVDLVKGMRLQVRLELLLLLLLLLLFVLQEERSGGPLLLRGGQEQGRLDVLLHDAPHGGPPAGPIAYRQRLVEVVHDFDALPP